MGLGRTETSVNIPQCSDFVLTQGLSLKLERADSASLAGQQALRASISSPSVNITSAGHHMQLLVKYGSWRVELRSHACMVSILSTEPVPQSHFSSLLIWFMS